MKPVRTSLESVNAAFVLSKLRDNWLHFNPLQTWPGHKGALKNAALDIGLESKVHGDVAFYYQEGRIVGARHALKTTLVSSVADAICQSKPRTKTVLEANGIPVPPGEIYSAEEKPAALDIVSERINTPMVFKPADGRGGSGVTTGVRTREGAEQAWSDASSASRSGKVIVEKEITGLDLRIFVVGGEVIAGAVRLPPFLVGDGMSSLRDLFHLLVEARLRNAYLAKHPVQVDWQLLEEHGHHEHSVPPKDHVVFLNGTANLSRGGVAYDVTEDLAPGILQLATSATSAIPGMDAAGVDLLVPNLAGTEGAAVVELNAGANVSVHEFPAFGAARPVAAAMLRQMVQQHR